MNKHWKDKWVKALRSGKYKQGRMRLRTRDSFCCLGVLCDISPLVTWEYDLASHALDTSIAAIFSDDTTNVGKINDVLLRELDLTNNEQSTLIQMNDREKSFKVIADYIEKEL